MCVYAGTDLQGRLEQGILSAKGHRTEAEATSPPVAGRECLASANVDPNAADHRVETMSGTWPWAPEQEIRADRGRPDMYTMRRVARRYGGEAA